MGSAGQGTDQLAICEKELVRKARGRHLLSCHSHPVLPTWVRDSQSQALLSVHHSRSHPFILRFTYLLLIILCIIYILYIKIYLFILKVGVRKGGKERDLPFASSCQHSFICQALAKQKPGSGASCRFP